MATRTNAARPSPESSEQVLAAVRSVAGPVTATELRKRLDHSASLPSRTVTLILEDAVMSGGLYRLPPKSAKGQPRYWDRDPRAMLRAAALEAIDGAQAPFTAKELIARLKLPLKIAETDLSELLAERLSSGTLHEIPPAAPKKKGRYWKREAVEFARQTLRDALLVRGPANEAALRKTVKWLGNDQFRQVVDGGLASGELWRHPPLTPSGKGLLGARPPSPEPYLKKVGAELAKVVGRCLDADMPRDVLKRVLVELIEATGIPLAGVTVACGTARRDADAAASTVDLIALMRRIEPGADRGALVGARDLRRVAQLEKEEFDRTVLELARQGRLSLHRHDYVASLAQGEQDDLVTDGQGTYYVGIALRQSPG